MPMPASAASTVLIRMARLVISATSSGRQLTALGNRTMTTELWNALSMRERLSATTYVPIMFGSSRRTTRAWSTYSAMVPHRSMP